MLLNIYEYEPSQDPKPKRYVPLNLGSEKFCYFKLNTIDQVSYVSFKGNLMLLPLGISQVIFVGILRVTPGRWHDSMGLGKDETQGGPSIFT